MAKKGEVVIKIDGDDSGFKEKMGGLGGIAKKGLAGVGIAAAAAGAAVLAIGKQALEAYADFEQLAGGTELLFGEASDFIMQKSKQAFKTVQMSQNDYLRQVNGFAVGLKTSLNGDAQAAAKLADKIVTAEADIVAATGNSQEAVQNAFNGIMKSNYTMLDNLQLGITPTKAGMQEVIDKVNEWNAANGEATHYMIDNLADVQSALVDYVEMQGMAGYAAAEGAETIQGSIASLKGAWENLLSGLADPEADVKALMDDLFSTLGNVIKNLLPIVKEAFFSLLGAVGDGLVELSDMVVGAFEPTYQSVRETSRAVEEHAEAQRKATEAAEEHAVAQLVEVENTKALFDELENLADASGKVQDADLLRAQTIVGELQAAGYTEITMNGNIVNSLDDVGKKIDEILEKKRASILLSSYEERYQEATTNITQALEDQTQAQLALAEAQKAINDANRDGHPVTLAMLAAVNDATEAVAEADNTYLQYSADIETYETANAMILAGKTAEAISYMNKRSTAVKQASDAVKKSHEEELASAEQEIKVADLRIQIAYDNMQKLNNEQNQKMFEEAVETGTEAYKNFEKLGGQLSAGIGAGISSPQAKATLIAAVRGLTSAVDGAFKVSWEIRSPSRKAQREIGEMLPAGIGKGIKSNAKEATDAAKELVDVIDIQLKAGIISEDEYYTELEKIRDNYLEKGTKEWYEYTLKIYDYQEDLYENEKKQLDDALKDLTTAYDKWIDHIEDKFEDVEKERDSFASKLKDYGELYSMDTVVGVEYEWQGNKLIEKDKLGFGLNDLSQQTAEIQHYADNLKALKSKNNVPVEFFQLLRGMSIKDGITFTDGLLAASEGDFDTYMQQWKDKQAAAEQVASELYQDDFSALKTELEDEFGEIPDEFFKIGKECGGDFVQSFMDEVSAKIEAAKSTLRSMFASVLPTTAYAGAGGYSSNSYSTTYVLTPSKGESTADQIQTVRDDETRRKLSNF